MATSREDQNAEIEHWTRDIWDLSQRNKHIPNLQFQAVQDFRNRDQVYIRNLRRDITVGRDAWGRTGKKQPVYVNLWIFLDSTIKDAAQGDNVTSTIDYSKLCKDLKQDVNDDESISNVAMRVFGSCIRQCLYDDMAERIQSFKLELTLPKAVLNSRKGVVYETERHSIKHHDETEFYKEEVRIEGIECACILGINPHERLEKQPVSIDLFFGLRRGETQQEPPSRQILNCYQEVVRAVIQRVEGSAFQTVERLATFVARTVTMEFTIAEVTVSVDKPFAVSDIEAPGVRITRTRDVFEKMGIWKQLD